MAQITSHEELEAWLKDKPADFAQVIALRGALRVLPYAFNKEAPQKWVSDYALSLMRAIIISWGVCNFPTYDMLAGANSALESADAAADAADAAISAADDFAAHASYTVAWAAVYAVSYAVDKDAYIAVDSAFPAASAANNTLDWLNIENDCEWLATNNNPATAARDLTRLDLWPSAKPGGWSQAWVSAVGRLAALNLICSVWVEWYNRRIEGHDAAFDIPGDHDRTEDQDILVRLADATNEDFWDKGATYVNTTLQSWIDEARQRASAKSATVAKVEAAKATKPVASDRINFFISYATVDEAMAREVEAVLAELGYTSIAQFKDFKQSSFVRSMREGLAKSERFIALYSNAYWSSDHCQSEWDAAYARDPGAKQRKIVPFLIEAMDLRQQPLASEIVYEPLHGLSKDERKKAIKQMIEYQPSARLS